MAEASKGSILVIDDDPDSLDFVRAVLEEAGYTVAVAENADQGMAAAAAQKPALIILDVQMPGKDGFTAFAEMQNDPELRDIPVCMLTGVGDRLGMRFTAEQMGDYVGKEPACYIEKPVDPEALQESVRQIIGG